MLNFLFSQTPFRFFLEPLWRDEAFSWLLAKRDLGEIIYITAQDFNPPLYYFVLHYWMEVFGTSEVALRSLSFLFYILGVFVVYEIIHTILKQSHKKSAFLIVLFVLNPVVLYYGFEARMYSMVFFLAVLTSYYYLKKEKWLYLLTAIVAVYTHYFLIPVVGCHFLFTLLTDWKKKYKDSKKLLVMPILAGFSLIPWIFYFISSNPALSDDFWIEPLRDELVRFVLPLLYSGLQRDFWYSFQDNPDVFQGFIGFNMLIAITAFFGGLATLKLKKIRSLYLFFALIAFLPVIAILTLNEIKPFFLPRYLIASSAFLSLFLIYCIAMMPRHFAMLLGGILIVYSWQYQTIQLEGRAKGTIDSTIKTIQTMASQDDVLYVTSELDFMVAQYYFGEDRVYIYNKPYDEIPQYVGKILIPESSVTDDLQPYPKKTFILTSETEYQVGSNFSYPIE